MLLIIHHRFLHNYQSLHKTRRNENVYGVGNGKTVNVPFIASCDTVWFTLTVYVPTPPVPVPNAVIYVFEATNVPITFIFNIIVPDDIAVTVNVVPDILPTKTAYGTVCVNLTKF